MSILNKHITLILLAAVIGMPCLADLRLASLFSDGMVLQREQKVAVWGWADAGAEVTVSFAGQQVSGRAAADGKFMVRLEAMQASAEPAILIVSAGDEKVEISNVLVGEVWLCSGQSNMQMAVKEAKDYEIEKASADYPLLRMFTVEQKTSLSIQQECNGSWAVCSPETVGGFSAVAYFFGREIHRELGVPVGLIHSSWGGSPVEAWSPMESLEKFPTALEYKAEMDHKAESFDEVAAKQHNERVWAEYNRKVEIAKANKTKWPAWVEKKIHPLKSHRYPANLYNTMIHPLVPYGLRGVIWYQGENNTRTIRDALVYRDLLENMVTVWRSEWSADFPFYAVQLVNFKKPTEDPVEDTGWTFVREGILQFSREVAGAGMAIGIDVGDAKDIHPKDKQTIGYRLARQALVKTYGKSGVPGGPVYRSMEKDGSKIIIRFDDVGSGLVEQGGEPLKWFAIAGKDQKFFAAPAAIVEDTVIVCSEQVPDPVAVRYAWANNPAGCNLFNKEGFPAAPFRTDDWPPVEE